MAQPLTPVYHADAATTQGVSRLKPVDLTPDDLRLRRVMAGIIGGRNVRKLAGRAPKW
jgi:hypothetical protein